MGNLRRYQISIDPSLSDGKKLCMDAVAYVDSPAIMVKGVAFDAVKKLKFTDLLKGRVAAPVLIPEVPIPRRDDSGEYEVVFSKEVIEKLYEDFMLNRNKSVFNLDHVSTEIAPSFILESWITVEPQKDKSFTKYGIEVPEGSLFFVSQFTDMEYFKREIIEKDRAAYSIEGFLGMELKSIKNKMEKQKFVQATTSEGVIVFTDAEVFAEGVDVYTMNEAGEKGDVPNGEHTLDNGIVITVEANKITSLVEPSSEESLDAETVEVIQKAVEPLIAEMRKAFEEKFAALKVELSNQPASQPAKQEVKPVALSAVEKVKLLTKKNK
jgi:hypothetical protein